jgi:hypothetical protein
LHGQLYYEVPVDSEKIRAEIVREERGRLKNEWVRILASAFDCSRTV